MRVCGHCACTVQLRAPSTDTTVIICSSVERGRNDDGATPGATSGATSTVSWPAITDKYALGWEHSALRPCLRKRTRAAADVQRTNRDAEVGGTRRPQTGFDALQFSKTTTMIACPLRTVWMAVALRDHGARQDETISSGATEAALTVRRAKKDDRRDRDESAAS